MEVVGLINKGENNDSFVKFKDSSVVLDKILDCQRSPCDKTGLGYKKEEEIFEDEVWSTKTPEAVPSTSKVVPHAPAHDKKEFRSKKLKQGVRPILKRNIRK